jgi:hypothetical protein
MPFRAFLTTNYDEFIEGAFWIQRGTSLPRLYEDTIDVVMHYFREKAPFILKLHGDIGNPSSIVLGYRSYERLLYSNNAYRHCLETIVSQSSILFIGFGGSDPDLDRIIGSVAAFEGRSKRHWILVPNGALPPLKSKRLWQDNGIRVIQYPKDPTHSGVDRFLHAIAERSSFKAPAPEHSTVIKKAPAVRTMVETEH